MPLLWPTLCSAAVPLAPFLLRAQSPRDWGGAGREDGLQAQDSLPPTRPPLCPCLAPGTWRSSGAGPRSGWSQRVLTAACLTLRCCPRIRTCLAWPVARAAAHLSAIRPSSAGAWDGGEGRGGACFRERRGTLMPRLSLPHGLGHDAQRVAEKANVDGQHRQEATQGE